MALLKIKLEKNESIESVKNLIIKSLADDEILESTEKWNDDLMYTLMDEMELEYSKMYLSMLKEILAVLKRGVV